MNCLGAHLNPAVSIAMLTLGSISILQCLVYIVARKNGFDQKRFLKMFFFLFVEYMGAMLAAFLVFGIYYDAINKYDGGERQVSQETTILFSITRKFRSLEIVQLQEFSALFPKRVLVKFVYSLIKFYPRLFY